ncbi:uncharacterized protein LOC142481178 [Ascaphus truei]|uniref:uncharacterized protein LOC142481178 n=1 Tax=Ascaphus truei TaxID=8439 RepID=UPI003F5ADA3A
MNSHLPLPASEEPLPHHAPPTLEPYAPPPQTRLAEEMSDSLFSDSGLLLARSLLGRRGHADPSPPPPSSPTSALRRRREFTPDEKKDNSYWDKRRKNNEAAKRSREKRRAGDIVLEGRVIALLEENARLRAELLALRFRFGLVRDPCEESRAYPAPCALHDPPPLPVPHSEDSGFSTPSVGSPVFFEDRIPEQELPPPPLPPPPPPPPPPAPSYYGAGAENPENSRGRLETLECYKSLPHKLRFKACAPGEEGLHSASVGGEAEQRRGGGFASEVPGPLGFSQQPLLCPRGQWGAQGQEGMPPLVSDSSDLRSQLASLSAEVAQLKRIFSEQGMTHGGPD